MNPLNQIQKVVDTLKNRGETDEYIASYLQKIIEGIAMLSPKLVNDYLSITIHNQK